jgi:hypothetical protein
VLPSGLKTILVVDSYVCFKIQKEEKNDFFFLVDWIISFSLITSWSCSGFGFDDNVVFQKSRAKDHHASTLFVNLGHLCGLFECDTPLVSVLSVENLY